MVKKMCETYGKKHAHYGLKGSGSKKRWCSPCAKLQLDDFHEALPASFFAERRNRALFTCVYGTLRLAPASSAVPKRNRAQPDRFSETEFIGSRDKNRPGQ